MLVNELKQILERYPDDAVVITEYQVDKIIYYTEVSDHSEDAGMLILKTKTYPARQHK